MKKILLPGSNCVDIGCHTGKILDRMMELAPDGNHWGFEPLPHLYEKLRQKYNGSKATLLPYALSNVEGAASFKYVKNSPGYSGFKRRTYHIPFPKIEELAVERKKLDSVIPADIKIDFIKLDVEGAELEVLAGAEQTIKGSRPYIIFEHGIGAAVHYGTRPDDIFIFFAGCEMRISLMGDWLLAKPPLSAASFSKQFYRDLNYYFIAHP